MEITAQDINNMLQTLKDCPTYVNPTTYILPKKFFNELVDSGIIPKDTTLFVGSEYIPDNVMYKVPHRDDCIDKLLGLNEEYRGLKRR